VVTATALTAATRSSAAVHHFVGSAPFAKSSNPAVDADLAAGSSQFLPLFGAFAASLESRNIQLRVR